MFNTAVYVATRDHNSYSSRHDNEHKNEERIMEIPIYVFDVMVSKYSKKVIKTFKRQGDAKNYIKKNGLDNAVVKSRKDGCRVVKFH